MKALWVAGLAAVVGSAATLLEMPDEIKSLPEPIRARWGRAFADVKALGGDLAEMAVALRKAGG